MFETYDDIMEIDEIAEALHIGRNSVYDLLRSGKIKSMKNGRDWKVPKICVEQYVRAVSYTHLDVYKRQTTSNVVT